MGPPCPFLVPRRSFRAWSYDSTPKPVEAATSLSSHQRSLALLPLEYALAAVRVQIVTHMWPSESQPESGVFVRDQVEALRRLERVDVEVRHFPPGKRSYLTAARALRRSRGERFDVVHAHYGLSGWSAL